MTDFSNLRLAETDLEHLIATGQSVRPRVILGDLERTRRLENHPSLLSDITALLSAKPRLPSKAASNLADRLDQIASAGSDLQNAFLKAIAAYLRGELSQPRGRPPKTNATHLDRRKLGAIAIALKNAFEVGDPFDDDIWALLGPEGKLGAVRGSKVSPGVALASTVTALRHLGLGTRSEQATANLISMHKRANLM